jgi:hypothetical protein
LAEVVARGEHHGAAAAFRGAVDDAPETTVTVDLIEKVVGTEAGVPFGGGIPERAASGGRGGTM